MLYNVKDISSFPEIKVLNSSDVREKKGLSTADMSMQGALLWEHMIDT